MDPKSNKHGKRAEKKEEDQDGYDKHGEEQEAYNNSYYNWGDENKDMKVMVSALAQIMASSQSHPLSSSSSQDLNPSSGQSQQQGSSGMYIIIDAYDNFSLINLSLKLYTIKPIWEEEEGWLLTRFDVPLHHI